MPIINTEEKLNAAIKAAVCEFEANSTFCVFGMAIQRSDNALTVSAIAIPVTRSVSNRKILVSDIEVTIE